MRKKTIRKLLIYCILGGFFVVTGCQTTLFAQAVDSVHIDLRKAIDIALSDAPSVRIADRNVKIKQYYKKEQIAALFPDVSLSASYQRTLKKQKMVMDFMGRTQEFEVGISNNYNGGASFALPVIMPALWASVKLSQMDVNLALETARSSKLEMVNQVKQAYYTLLLARESYEVLQQNYHNQELSNQLVNNQYRQGLVSEFEKLRSDVSLQNFRPAVSSAEKAVSLATMNLKIILGMNIAEPVVFDGHLSDYEEYVLRASIPSADSLQSDMNSTLRQLDIGIRTLKQSKKLITSTACPSLVLSGNYTFMSLSNDFKFSNYRWFPYSAIGIALKVPIISWAATSFKMKEADLNIANMQDQRLNAERGIRVQIQNSLNNMQQAVEDLSSNRETLLQAQRACDIAKKQYEVGLSTWLDLNTAELALVSTQLTYNQSLHKYLTASATLDSILGKDL